MAAAVNKSPHYEETYALVSEILENVHFLDSFVLRCRLCAALLLAGRSEGSSFFKEVSCYWCLFPIYNLKQMLCPLII